MFDRGRGGWGGRGEPPAAEDAQTYIESLLPDDWFTAAPQISVDRDEIVIIGTIEEPTSAGSAQERAAAARRRIAVFREETRHDRIGVAQQIEHRYRRRVAWGVACGDTKELFTALSAPVMTRLRQPERRVLDTLVDAGVARSRSEALAWCVRLVGKHSDAWLAELRTAMAAVDELRRRGPDGDSDTGSPADEDGAGESASTV